MWLICIVRNHAVLPEINAAVVTPSHGLFLPHRGENIIQYHKLKFSVQYLTCRVLRCKNPLLGVVAFSARMQTSLHSGPMLHCFPQAAGPTPSQSPPLQSHRPTHVIWFELAEDDIGPSDIFSIWYMYIWCCSKLFFPFLWQLFNL